METFTPDVCVVLGDAAQVDSALLLHLLVTEAVSFGAIDNCKVRQIAHIVKAQHKC